MQAVVMANKQIADEMFETFQQGEVSNCKLVFVGQQPTRSFAVGPRDQLVAPVVKLKTFKSL